MTDMGIAEGRKWRKLRPYTGAVFAAFPWQELDGPSVVPVPLFASTHCQDKQKSYLFNLLLLCR